jgi:hypothetical protein
VATSGGGTAATAASRQPSRNRGLLAIRRVLHRPAADQVTRTGPRLLLATGDLPLACFASAIVTVSRAPRGCQPTRRLHCPHGPLWPKHHFESAADVLACFASHHNFVMQPYLAARWGRHSCWGFVIKLPLVIKWHACSSKGPYPCTELRTRAGRDNTRQCCRAGFLASPSLDCHQSTMLQCSWPGWQ